MISKKDKETIRNNALLADTKGMLQAAQLEVIHRNEWLKMMAPKACGGLELALPDAIRLEEELAETDGSTAWVITLCSGAGWFAGFLPMEVASNIIAIPQLCIAGSGATGTAELMDDHYLLTGNWAHASGAPWATHFTANAQLMKEGKALHNADGTAKTKSFIFPRQEVRLIDGWDTTGMRATASKKYATTACKVPLACCFETLPELAVATGVLYQFPFLSLAELTLAANICGIARNFLCLATPVIEERKSSRSGAKLGTIAAVNNSIKKAVFDLENSRSNFYKIVESSWQCVEKGDVLTDETRKEITTAALALVATCRDAVHTIYPFCGLEAAMQNNHLNLAWRDFQTAAQHSLLLGY